MQEAHPSALNHSSGNSSRKHQPGKYGLAALLVALAACFNPFTLQYAVYQAGFLEKTAKQLSSFSHLNDLLWYLPGLVDLLLLVPAGLILFGRYPLKHYFNHARKFNLFLLWTLIGIYMVSNPILTGRFVWLRLILILFSFWIGIRCFYLTFVRKREAPLRFRTLRTSLYGLLMLMLILEGVFLFVRRSHVYNGTLASRSWFAKYWDQNDLKLRDRPYTYSDLHKKKRILLLGDSFTAGHGLADVRERYGEVLEDLLDSTRVRVLNLGSNGADSGDQAEKLRSFPYTGDLLIASYYPNDIERVAIRPDNEPGKLIPYQGVPFPLRFVIRRVRSLNFLYWSYPQLSLLTDYKGFLKRAYADPATLSRHFADLDSILDSAREREMPVLYLLFPFMENPQGSGFALDPVADFLDRRQVPYIRVSGLVKGVDWHDLVVNVNDSHPSMRVNQWVGDTLAKRVRLMKGWEAF